MPPGPLVLDEPADRWFSRPVARLLVPLLARTPITPNQVTGLAALAGVGSGVAFGLRHGWLFAILTAVFLVLDCCDGQLARRRGTSGGVLGRAVDGFGDVSSAISIHSGLIAWLVYDHGWALGLPLGLAATASMGLGAFLLDRHKQRYRGEVDDVAQVERELAAATGWRRLVLRTFRTYARRIALERVMPDLPGYRVRTRLPMRLFLWCGHSTHIAVWSVFAVLERPLEYALVAVGPLNAILFAALWLQSRAVRAHAAGTPTVG